MRTVVVPKSSSFSQAQGKALENLCASHETVSVQNDGQGLMGRQKKTGQWSQGQKMKVRAWVDYHHRNLPPGAEGVGGGSQGGGCWQGWVPSLKSFPASSSLLVVAVSPWLWLTAESPQCLPPPSLGNNVATPTCLTIRAPAVYKWGHSLRSWNQGLQSLFMEDPSETVMDELIKAGCWWGWKEDSLRWERLPAEIWDSTMSGTRGSSVNGTFIQLDIGGFLWKWLRSNCDCS